jgi:hypothetical protein
LKEKKEKRNHLKGMGKKTKDQFLIHQILNDEVETTEF